VSSRRTICLEASEVSTVSGLSVVASAFSGNFSCFPRSTFSFQSCVAASRPEEVALAAGIGFSPALMKAMVFYIGRRHLQWMIPLQMVSAMAIQDLVMAPSVAPLVQGSRTADEEALDCGDWDLVDQEGPEDPREDAVYIQALNLRGNPDLSTAPSQASSSWLVALIDAVSLKLQSNTFPLLFTGFSVMGGIWVLPNAKRNLSMVFPFLSTRDLDLKLMRAQVISPSGSTCSLGHMLLSQSGHPWRPDLVRGPLH